MGALMAEGVALTKGGGVACLREGFPLDINIFILAGIL